MSNSLTQFKKGKDRIYFGKSLPFIPLNKKSRWTSGTTSKMNKRGRDTKV